MFLQNVQTNGLFLQILHKKGQKIHVYLGGTQEIHPIFDPDFSFNRKPSKNDSWQHVSMIAI